MNNEFKFIHMILKFSKEKTKKKHKHLIKDYINQFYSLNQN